MFDWEQLLFDSGNIVQCTLHSKFNNRAKPFLLIVSAIVVLFEAELGPEHLWVINGRYIKSVQYPPPYSWLPATSRIAKAISDCHIHLRLQTIAQIVLLIITSSSSIICCLVCLLCPLNFIVVSSFSFNVFFDTWYLNKCFCDTETHNGSNIHHCQHKRLLISRLKIIFNEIDVVLFVHGFIQHIKQSVITLVTKVRTSFITVSPWRSYRPQRNAGGSFSCDACHGCTCAG